MFAQTVSRTKKLGRSQCSSRTCLKTKLINLVSDFSAYILEKIRRLVLVRIFIVLLHTYGNWSQRIQSNCSECDMASSLPTMRQNNGTSLGSFWRSCLAW